MINVFLFLFFCFVTTLKLAVIRYNFSIALQKRCTYIRFDEYPTSRRRVLNMYVQAIFCLFSSWKSIKRYAPLLAPKQSDLFREQVRQVFPPIPAISNEFCLSTVKAQKKGKKDISVPSVSDLVQALFKNRAKHAIACERRRISGCRLSPPFFLGAWNKGRKNQMLSQAKHANVGNKS